MEEEIKIQEAEIEPIKNDSEKKGELDLVFADEEKKRRADIYIEFVLIFILGILIGVAVKTEAVKRITIGFDDYKMKIFSQDYDMSALQADIIRKNAEENQAPAEGENQDAPQEESAN